MRDFISYFDVDVLILMQYKFYLSLEHVWTTWLNDKAVLGCINGVTHNLIWCNMVLNGLKSGNSMLV